jgi:hypothetical protein
MQKCDGRRIWLQNPITLLGKNRLPMTSGGRGTNCRPVIRQFHGSLSGYGELNECNRLCIVMDADAKKVTDNPVTG